MEARHWDGRHHEGKSYGPFDFLNPTQRKFKLPLHGTERYASRGALRKKDRNGVADQGLASAPRRGNIQAGDVERLFRTRDNRKGRLSFLSLLLVDDHQDETILISTVCRPPRNNDYPLPRTTRCSPLNLNPPRNPA